MEVHEAEPGDWRTQVQVDDKLPADTAQGLAVAHPGQGIHYLLVPGQLDAKPVPLTSPGKSAAVILLDTAVHRSGVFDIT